MPSAGFVSVIPQIVTIPLDVALNLNNFLPQCPPGSKLTAITVVKVDPGVSLQMAYGSGNLAKTVFQGQCFTFGSFGECVGVMDGGLYLGTGGVAVAGGVVQLELSFWYADGGGTASTVAAQ